MSERLDPGDRLLLIGAGALLVLGAVLATVFRPGEVEEPESAQIASTYAPGSGGAQATWLLLRDLGYHVARWEHAPRDLPLPDSLDVVLVLAQPVVRATSEERAAIDRFVRHGGRLLVAGDADGLAPGAGTRAAWDTTHAVCWRLREDDASRRARSIVLRRRAVWRGLTPWADTMGAMPDGHGSVPPGDVAGVDTLYAGPEGPAVVTWPWHDGTVTWWAGTTPLTNGGLDDRDNLALLLDTLGPPGRTRVLWDEYFHGERGTVAGYLARTPLRWGALQALLLFAAACMAFARRTGPVRTPGAAARASLLEFVDALGGLYGRAGATRAVVKLALDDFRLRLLRRLALPAGTSDEALVAAARRRLGHGDDTLVDLLARARRVERVGIDDDDALALVRGLDHWDRLWRRPATQGADAPRREGA